jgi:hypothetical protein
MRRTAWNVAVSMPAAGVTAVVDGAPTAGALLMTALVGRRARAARAGLDRVDHHGGDGRLCRARNRRNHFARGR